MKKIDEIKCLCISCMQKHNVDIVEEEENNIFKNEAIEYIAKYHYCSNTDEFYADEDQISLNDIAMKDAYRLKVGLLTSNEIASIRKKYNISQSDLALILGWGEKTITRYEGHQVQDSAHDSILRKIDSDPEWYLELLDVYNAKHKMSAYNKYRDTALSLFENKKNEYLKKSIMGDYAKFDKLDGRNGYTALNLQKVVDIIRYFSNSTRVKLLYEVKLMKMLWYADALCFKTTGRSMTGLVYMSLPMGAVPVAYERIVNLNGVIYEEKEFNNGIGRHFMPDENHDYEFLTDSDKEILDCIIDKYGSSTKKEIVDAMHNEVAYKETTESDIILYNYTKRLSI